MCLRTVSIALAAAFAAMISMSAAEAGMNNINVSPRVGTTQTTPSMPDVKVRPHMINAKIQLHCYHTRERNDLGVWVHRTHCG